MTRAAHLTRIALGRSAYQSDAIPSAIDGSNDDSEQLRQDDSPVDRRIGKSSGPKKLSKRYEAAQRRAKNEILEIVGVTERLDVSKRANYAVELPKIELTSQELRKLEGKENSFGADLIFAVDLTHLAATWWLDTLRARIQAGLVQANVPFTALLVQEYVLFRKSSYIDRFHRLTAGLATDLVGSLVSDMFHNYIRDHIRLARRKVCHFDISKNNKRIIMNAMRVLDVASYLATELLFFSNSIFATLQRLHIHNAFMDWSVLRTFDPYGSYSALNWGLRPGPSSLPLSVRVMNVILSPVCLCVIHHAMSDWGARWCNLLLHFPPQPAITAPSQAPFYNYQKSTVTGYLRPLTKFRSFCLRKLGWSHEAYLESHTIAIESTNDDDSTLDARELLLTLGATEDEVAVSPHVQSLGHDFTINIPLDGDSLSDTTSMDEDYDYDETTNTPIEFHSTTLSSLPQEDLGHELNNFLWKTIKIPVQIILYRSIMRAWSEQPLYAHSRGISPFIPVSSFPDQKSGIFSALFGTLGRDSLGSLGSVVGKIGMCLALELVIDAGTWLGLYFYVRWKGKRSFYWGQL